MKLLNRAKLAGKTLPIFFGFGLVIAAGAFDASAKDETVTQIAAAKCSVPAASAAEPSAADLTAAYECIRPALQAGYDKSGDKFAKAYAGWKIFNKNPYRSETHGRRFANNYANDIAKARYSKFEDSTEKFPVGSVLAKDTFTVNKKGGVGVGPFFIMEKMEKGWNKASDDWKYTLMLPNGKIFGVTNGVNSKKVKFCIDCHIAVAEDQDSSFFLPEELRVN